MPFTGFPCGLLSGRGVKPNPCEACKLRDSSVLAALSEEERDRISSIITTVRCGPRQTIFHEGDPADHLFNVTGGTVKLYKLLPDGRRQITGFLFPGDFLGLAMIDCYAYSAEAVGEVSLCRFPRLKLEALLEEFPKVEKRLLGMASNELAAAQDQMLLLGRKTAREKIASFLLLLARRAVNADRPDDVLELPMSRTDIADYLGLTIETVSRTLTGFKKVGIISMIENGQILIESRAEMEKAAGGG
jgi:CRP/FNR family transcriptional regulator